MSNKVIYNFINHLIDETQPIKKISINVFCEKRIAKKLLLVELKIYCLVKSQFGID